MIKDGKYYRAHSFNVGNMAKDFPRVQVAWKVEWREYVGGKVVRSDSYTTTNNPNLPHDWQSAG